MHDKNHMSLDIETLAKVPNSVVISIGISINNPQAGTSVTRRILVDRASQLKMGRETDPETLEWWSNQSDEARAVSFPEDERAFIQPTNACLIIRDMWETHQCHMAWGFGAIFDLGILEDLGRDTGILMPWSHRQQGCLRTLSAIYPDIPRPTPVVAHDPMWDAEAQGEWLSNILMRHAGALG